MLDGAEIGSVRLVKAHRNFGQLMPYKPILGSSTTSQAVYSVVITMVCRRCGKAFEESINGNWICADGHVETFFVAGLQPIFN